MTRVPMILELTAYNFKRLSGSVFLFCLRQWRTETNPAIRTFYKAASVSYIYYRGTSTNKLVPLLTYVIADVNRRSLTVLSLDYLRLSNSSRNLYRVINTISWLRNITHGCSVLLHVETLRIFLYIVSLSKAMDISVDVTLTGPTCHEEYSATRLLKVLAFSIQ